MSVYTLNIVDNISLVDTLSGALSISVGDIIIISEQAQDNLSGPITDSVTVLDSISLNFRPRRSGMAGGAWYIKNLDRMIALNLFNTIGLQELKAKPEFRAKRAAEAKEHKPTAVEVAAQRKKARVAERKRFLQARDGDEAAQAADSVKIALQVAAAAAVVIVVVGGVIIAVKKKDG